MAALTVACGGDGTAPVPSGYPGGGRLVAFVSTRDGNSEIYSMRPDGTEPRRLTVDSAIDYDPELSPDGSRIAFTHWEGEAWKIYVMNADGSGLRRLLPSSEGNEHSPSWSPDGRQLAYDSDAKPAPYDGEAQRIWIMAADGGSPPQPLREGFVPRWGPTGLIAFGQLDDNGHTQLFTMRADGTDVHLISDGTLDDFDPAWSPDGRRIAFDAGDVPNGRRAQLFVVGVDGTGRTQVLADAPAAAEGAPVWSPDGSRILFQSTRDGSGTQLFTVRLPDANVQQLTTAGSYNGLPSWR